MSASTLLKNKEQVVFFAGAGRAAEQGRTILRVSNEPATFSGIVSNRWQL
jgi:hypothetical protein